MNDTSLKKSRVLYIIEAGLEYLISILVSGAFLAVITKELGLSQAAAGVCGFVATICVSPLVSFIQKEENMLFGLNVYAQQVTSVIAILFTVITILYLHYRIIRGNNHTFSGVLFFGDPSENRTTCIRLRLYTFFMSARLISRSAK